MGPIISEIELQFDKNAIAKNSSWQIHRFSVRSLGYRLKALDSFTSSFLKSR